MRLEVRRSSSFKALEDTDGRETGAGEADPDVVAKRAALVSRCDQVKALQERLEARGEISLSEGDPASRH